MQNKRFTVVLFITVLTAPLVVLGKKMIFKCQNESGELIYQKSACAGSTETVDFWTPEEPNNVVPEGSMLSEYQKNTDNPKKEPVILTLKQNSNGHYLTDGSINDKPLKFVVDTGASLVSLPESAAHNALIYCDNKLQIDTANGTVDSCTATINTLKFGPFIIKNVTAVLQTNLAQPLLGMNILQNFKIEQNYGEMKLSILENKADPNEASSTSP